MTTFDNEQKQAEFEAFTAWWSAVSKRPFSAATRSLLNQIRNISTANYGSKATDELRRANVVIGTEQLQERRLGKRDGDGTRRSQSPAQQKPQANSARLERQRQRAAQNARLAVQSPVVVDDIILPKVLKNIVDEPTDLFSAAAEMKAAEIVENYGREAISEYLFNTGMARDEMEQKTDRQLANILKKKLGENPE